MKPLLAILILLIGASAHAGDTIDMPASGVRIMIREVEKIPGFRGGIVDLKDIVQGVKDDQMVSVEAVTWQYYAIEVAWWKHASPSEKLSYTASVIYYRFKGGFWSIAGRGIPDRLFSPGCD